MMTSATFFKGFAIFTVLFIIGFKYHVNVKEQQYKEGFIAGNLYMADTLHQAIKAQHQNDTAYTAVQLFGHKDTVWLIMQTDSLWRAWQKQNQ